MPQHPGQENKKLEELGFKKKLGGHSFWDTDNQRAKAYDYMKRHGLDRENEQVRISVRQMYRMKEAKNGNQVLPETQGPIRNYEGVPKKLNPNKANKVVNATIDALVARDVETTSNRATTSVAARQAREDNKSWVQYSSRAGDEEKPPCTSRVWKGEKYDPVNKKWLPPEPNAPTDYFSWYLEFLFPMRRNAIALGAIHETWCEELESDDRVMMFKPRDHYKTTIISTGYAVYQLCEFQNNYWPILIVSKADMNTKDIMQSIRQHLEKNERILSFYGYIINEELKNDQNSIFMVYQDIGDRDPALYCATFGANIVMGTHPRMAILDDIETKALSKALMYQAKTLLDKSLLAGLPNGAKLILVGTLKGWDHTNDIYLYAKKKGVFSVYEDPAVFKIDPETGKAILDEKGNRVWGMPDMKYVDWWKERVPDLDEDGNQKTLRNGRLKWKNEIRIVVKEGKEKEWKSIYPERYTVIDIIRKRIETREVDRESDDTFWAEFFLIPRKPGGNFFKSERIKNFPPRGHVSMHSYLEWIREYHIPIVIWVDPGGKKSHGISMACLCFYQHEVHVLDLAVIRTGIPKAAEKIVDWWDKYHVVVAGCEANFDQKETFAETLQRECDYYCDRNGWNEIKVYVQGIMNKGDKILRIQTHMKVITGFDVDESNFYVNQDAEDYEQFLNEYESFPIILPGAEHEWDLMDCVTSGRIHLELTVATCDDCYGY